ncbi:hypothetical protein [Actinomadura geliboluensis]
MPLAEGDPFHSPVHRWRGIVNALACWCGRVLLEAAPARRPRDVERPLVGMSRHLALEKSRLMEEVIDRVLRDVGRGTHLMTNF